MLQINMLMERVEMKKRFCVVAEYGVTVKKTCLMYVISKAKNRIKILSALSLLLIPSKEKDEVCVYVNIVFVLIK